MVFPKSILSMHKHLPASLHFLGRSSFWEKVVSKKQYSNPVDDAKNDLGITTHTAKSPINIEVVVCAVCTMDYYF